MPFETSIARAGESMGWETAVGRLDLPGCTLLAADRLEAKRIPDPNEVIYCGRR